MRVSMQKAASIWESAGQAEVGECLELTNLAGLTMDADAENAHHTRHSEFLKSLPHLMTRAHVTALGRVTTLKLKP